MYPGRPSDEPGADYKDAVIAIGGQLNRGDIEVHVRSSDWHTHQHHRNKTYNGIVLHVVMWHDAKEETRLENGKSIPTICLANRRPAKSMHKKLYTPPYQSCRCNTAGLDREEILKILDCAGDVRFREKQSAFRKELEIINAGQCLYQGMMVALGYSRNTAPFHKVAEFLPLNLLESMIYQNPDDMVIARTESMLLGTAGFLTSQKSGAPLGFENDVWMGKLEKEWASGGGRLSLCSGDWQIFRVRPANFPARRLAGMAQLLFRYRNGGLLKGICNLVEESAQKGDWQKLEDGLTVTANGYWKDHFASGKICSKLDPFLIGRSRAVEIIINILLPFFAVFYECKGEAGAWGQIFNLYCDYPVSAENTVVRHMRHQLGLRQSQVKSARCQQGLLHLYKRFCTQGKCGECPLE